MESPGATGGSTSHSHSYTTVPYHDHGVTSSTTTPHTHDYTKPTSTLGISSPTITAFGLSSWGGFTGGNSTIHSHNAQNEGGIGLVMSEEETFIPPYLELAFIEKQTNDPIIPIGLIVIWTGNIATIPTDWELCNGSNGTPDLRDNFLRGTLPGEDPGTSGGSLTHNHTYTDIPTHSHSIDNGGVYHDHGVNAASVGFYAQAGGVSVILSASGHTEYADAPHTHDISEVGVTNATTQETDNLPPYFKVAFIMNTVQANALPLGVISMWGDSVANIPSGWNQANGTNNTPNLLNRFLKGVANGEQPGITGGSDTHNHTYTDVPLHSHNVLSDLMHHRHTMNVIGTTINYFFGGSRPIYNSGSTTGTSDSSTPGNPSHNHNVNPTGDSSPYTSYENSLPPYVKLIFIQKRLSISNPSPENGAISIGYNPILSVDVNDIDGDDLTLSFYNASDNNLIGNDIILGGSGTASVPWSGLASGTSYSWYVKSNDSLSSKSSDTWIFTTNRAPDDPVNPNPDDGAIGINYSPTLSVDVFDVDGDSLTVTFYNSSDNSVIDAVIIPDGNGTASVNWSGLSVGTNYSWYAISDDGLNVNQSTTWLFTTNDVPNVPTNPTPNDKATNISYNPTLSVDVIDDDGDDLTVSFYNASDDSIIDVDIVFGGTGTASVTWSGLSSGTNYSWYSISDDGFNVNQSATWSFITNLIPGEPTNPSPADNATDLIYSPILSVDVIDDDGDDLNVSFYDASDDSLIDIDTVLEGSGTASVTWSGLSGGTNYSWYAISDDGLSVNQSVTWSFTTKNAPNTPTNPTPNDGATGISYNPTLSVDVFHDDGDDLTVTFYNASNDSIIDVDIVYGGNGTASVTWSGLASGTSFLWYAISDDGLSANQSATWSFTTNKIPNLPILLNPNNGSIGVGLNPTLGVEVSDDDGDDLIVIFWDASDDSVIDIKIVLGGSGVVSVTWSGLSSGTIYSWYATSSDGLNGIRSTTWSFTTNHAPNAPTNPIPNDGAIDISYSPALSVDVFDIDGDDLTVTFYDASDDSIIDTDIVLGGNDTISVIWPGLSSGTNYSWYAISDDGISANQSVIWSFTTGNVVVVPINPTPYNGAISISYNPTLSVNAFDPDGDDLTVSFYNASDDSLIDTDILYGGNGAASVTWSGLSSGTSYSWYVTSDDGSGAVQSSTWSFTTNRIPDDPTNPSPSNGAVNIGENPTLTVDVFDYDGDWLTVTFYNASDNSVISDVYIEGNGIALIYWFGVSANMICTWYVIVDDGLSTTQSPTWTFTTIYEESGTPPPQQPSIPLPGLGILGLIVIGTTGILSVITYLRRIKFE